MKRRGPKVLTAKVVWNLVMSMVKRVSDSGGTITPSCIRHHSLACIYSERTSDVQKQVDRLVSNSLFEGLDIVRR